MHNCRAGLQPMHGGCDVDTQGGGGRGRAGTGFRGTVRLAVDGDGDDDRLRAVGVKRSWTEG